MLECCSGSGPRWEWSRRWELNPRPAVYETAALPLSYVGIGGGLYPGSVARETSVAMSFWVTEAGGRPHVGKKTRTLSSFSRLRLHQDDRARFCSLFAYHSNGAWTD